MTDGRPVPMGGVWRPASVTGSFTAFPRRRGGQPEGDLA